MKRRTIALLLSMSMAFSVFAPSVFAEERIESNLQQVQSQDENQGHVVESETNLNLLQNAPQVSKAFINKVNKYVVLNNETLQYSLSSSARTALTTEEFM